MSDFFDGVRDLIKQNSVLLGQIAKNQSLLGNHTWNASPVALKLIESKLKEDEFYKQLGDLDNDT